MGEQDLRGQTRVMPPSRHQTKAAVTRKSRRTEGIQFSRWDMDTLGRYRQYFKLTKASHQPKLAAIAARHFQTQNIDTRNVEDEIVNDFLDAITEHQQRQSIESG